MITGFVIQGLLCVQAPVGGRDSRADFGDRKLNEF